MQISPELKKNIDEIVFQIKTGKVIPIIGSDLLNDEFGNDEGDLDFQKMLIKTHSGDDNLEDKFNEEHQTRNLTGFELINQYYHSLGKSKDTFKLRFSQTIQQERFKWKLISESLEKLVCIKHFQLFINGNFMNSLELAFNAFRAEGANLEEIKSCYTVLSYNPISADDLPQRAPLRPFHLNLQKPIIYNLFGTHDELHGNYVLTDADYIELIYDLINNRQEKFVNLLSYLNEGNLLFLGCNFPDWFFRFFIRICVGERLDSDLSLQRKTVIDSLNDIDSSRSIFIKNYEITKLNINCNQLINEIYKAFKVIEGTPDLIPNFKTNKNNNNVFISYCRQDEPVIRVIIEQFEGKYINYFIDYEQITTGSSIDQTIKDAIDKCCLFLPVVSKNLSSSSEYFCKEWNYAIRTGKTIIPIFKEFVKYNMPLPCGDEDSEIRNRILNKDNGLGIVLSIDYQIPEKNLKEIKAIQYKSRVSGLKQFPI
jgi:hypothetical protein